MRSFVFLASLLPLVLACDNPENDACASIMTASSADAATFCLTYTEAANTATAGLPDFASYCSSKPKKLSSACSCLVANTLATVAATSTGVRTFKCWIYYSVLTFAQFSNTTVAVATSVVASTTDAAAVSESTAVSVASETAVASSTDAAQVSESTSASLASVTAAPATSDSSPVATSVADAKAADTSSAAAVATGTACTVTAYSGISSAVASCTNIVLQDIAMPESETLDLTALQDGTTVTFAGNTVSYRLLPLDRH